jgi:hypothetical protein
MSPRLLLLACLAAGACLAGGLASAQPQDEDGSTCGLWGIAAPGDDERGVRLGVRLGEIKPAGGWPSDEVRLYDKLEHQLLRYDTQAGGLPGRLIVQTIRCDGGEPLVVRSGIGGAKEYDIGRESWRARETRALVRETGTLVGWSTVTVRSLVNPLPING